MTTRRDVLRIAAALPAAGLTAGLGAGLLAACRSGAETTDVPDRLLFSTKDGLVLVDGRDGALAGGPYPGIASRRSEPTATATIATVDTAGDGQPRLRVLKPGDGAQAGREVVIESALRPRIVSPDGLFVALASGAESDTYRPVGREVTTILIAGPTGRTQRLDLPGCVEPEAFSPAANSLFVLDYLPPTDPDRYRVRIVDLATGAMTPLWTRQKQVVPVGAEEEMRGLGRQAVFAPQRNYLYTLYTHQPEHEHTRDLINGAHDGAHDGARDDAPHVHAFVHTLSVDQGFAYCVDLPTPFGEGPPQTHAIALAPSSNNPIVIDTAGGAVVQIDGESLTWTRTAVFPGGSTEPAFAAASLGSCYVGSGDTVRVLDTTSLGVTATWRVAEPIRGLSISPDRARVWIGQTERIVALDATSGRPVASVAARGLDVLTEVLAR